MGFEAVKSEDASAEILRGIERADGSATAAAFATPNRLLAVAIMVLSQLLLLPLLPRDDADTSALVKFERMEESTLTTGLILHRAQAQIE
jgi:hypothetical protein